MGQGALAGAPGPSGGGCLPYCIRYGLQLIEKGRSLSLGRQGQYQGAGQCFLEGGEYFPAGHPTRHAGAVDQQHAVPRVGQQLAEYQDQGQAESSGIQAAQGLHAVQRPGIVLPLCQRQRPGRPEGRRARVGAQAEAGDPLSFVSGREAAGEGGLAATRRAEQQERPARHTEAGGNGLGVVWQGGEGGFQGQVIVRWSYPGTPPV